MMSLRGPWLIALEATVWMIVGDVERERLCPPWVPSTSMILVGEREYDLLRRGPLDRPREPST